jgi:hypothetical protein
MEKIFMIATIIFVPILVIAAPTVVSVSDDVGITTLQWLLNAAYGGLCVLGGWTLKFFHERITTIERSDEEIYNKLHMLELVVAGHYVKREDLEKLSQALFVKLDKIEEKLDNKVDKDAAHGFYKG